MATLSYRYAGHLVNAIVRRHGRVLLVQLLVQQQGPADPEPGWALPGGRVEPGEELLAALGRELYEETGLTLDSVPRVAFIVQVQHDSGDGQVDKWLAVSFSCDAVGEIQPRDPDGLVLAAAWIEEGDALDRLALLDWYDCTPLRRWLSGEAAAGTVYTVRRG